MTLFAADNVHPNDAGHDAIAAMLFAALSAEIGNLEPVIEIGFGSSWQTEPDDVVWFDVTGEVMDRQASVKTTRGATAAFGQPDTGDATLTLRNHDRRYDPLNADGPHFGDLIPGVPIRVTAFPPNQAMAHVWQGTIKSWPQRYAEGNQYAYVPVQAYDGFDKLGRAKIPRSALEVALIADDPEALWPLDEASGEVMSDRSGNAHNGTFQNVTLGGDPIAVGLGAAAEFAQGEGSRALPSPSPIITAYPVTMEAVVYYEEQLVGDSQTVLWHSPDAAVTSWMALFVGGSGADNKVLFGIVNGSVIRSALGETELSGGIHHVAVRLNTATNWDIFVDGVEETTTNPVAGSPTWPAAWTFWALGNTYGSSKGDYGLGGKLNAVTLYDTALSDARIAAHAAAALAPLEDQRSDERIDWVLDELAWPVGLRDLEDGQSTLGAATFKPGDDALTYLQLVTDTEDGLLFIAADGTLRFLDRYWRYTATEATVAQAVFSDTGSDISVATFQLEPADDELIVNEARFTRRDGTQQVAVDEASRALYGPAELQRSDLLHRTDNETLSLAQWTVATRSEPMPHVPKVRVNLYKQTPTVQAQLLALDLGHRVSCVRTPQEQGDAFDLDFVVAGVAHEFTRVDWFVDFYLTPVPEVTLSPFVWGVSEWDGTDAWAY